METEARPSDAAQGHAAIAELLVELENAGWATRNIYGINLAEKALVNAIRHGNRSDINKEIGMRFYLNDNRLLMEIEDEGAGFDPAKLPIPRKTNSSIAPTAAACC